GAGEVVEVDETFIGKIDGAPKKLQRGQNAFRNIVMTLVTRGGSARSFHVDGTTMGTLLPIIRANIQAETAVMTDEATWYQSLADSFASHATVVHSKDEYVRNELFAMPSGKVEARMISTNTVEGYYSIFKRGMKGIYQHCAEKHLHRYLAEFDFRYSN